MVIACLMFGLACLICAVVLQRKNPWLLIVLYWFLAAFRNAVEMIVGTGG